LLKAAGGQDALFESNHFGETPFDVALQYGFEDLMNYFLANGASYDEYRIKPDFRVDQSDCSPLGTVLGYKTQVDFLMQLDPKPNLVVTASGMNVFHVLASKEAALGK
jgi:ankyrin repeat protein